MIVPSGCAPTKVQQRFGLSFWINAIGYGYSASRTENAFSTFIQFQVSPIVV